MLAAKARGGAGMGFSPCLPCKQDLGEAPSEARVPRPGGSMQVLQHAHVRCALRLPVGGGQQGTNMTMPQTCICCTNASAALIHMPPPCTCCTHAYAATMHMLQPCKCCTHAHAAHMHLPQHASAASMHMPHQYCINASAAPTVMQVNLA